MTELYNKTNINIFDNTTDLAGITARSLLQTNDKCGKIDKLVGIITDLGLDQISNDIVNHNETIDELEQFISEQDELFQQHKLDIDAIGTEMTGIQESFSLVTNDLEQIKIGLTSS